MLKEPSSFPKHETRTSNMSEKKPKTLKTSSIFLCYPLSHNAKLQSRESSMKTNRNGTRNSIIKHNANLLAKSTNAAASPNPFTCMFVLS